MRNFYPAGTDRHQMARPIPWGSEDVVDGRHGIGALVLKMFETQETPPYRLIEPISSERRLAGLRRLWSYHRYSA